MVNDNNTIAMAIALLFGGVQVLIQQAIVLKVARKKFPLWRMILATVTVMVVHNLVGLFIDVTSLLGMGLWGLILCLAFFVVYWQPPFKSLLMGIGQLMMIFSVEFVLQLIATLLSVFEVSFAIKNAVLRFAGIFVLSAIYYVINRISFDLEELIAKGAFKYNVLVYTLFLFFYMVPTTTSVYQQHKANIFPVNSIYNTAIFLGFFVYNIILVRNVIKATDAKHQLEVQQLYTETMEKSFNDLRSYRHDYSNMMNALSSLIDAEDMDGLREFRKGLQPELRGINNTAEITRQLKNSPVLRNIMVAKMSYAALQDVDLHISILSEMKLSYFNIADFARIIGILLDNALEAAAQSAQKYVEVNMRMEKGVAHIRVKNTFRDKPDLERIGNGYTTKADHEGLGVSRVRSIVKKYTSKGYACRFDMQCGDGVFVATLKI